MSPTEAAGNDNPFPGLRPFREDEEHLFFGRERQIDRMIDKLSPARFLAIVGTSGSGKSSLVNCGLRPALHRGLMAQAGTAWKVAQFRPGNNPVRALGHALAAPGILFAQEAASEPAAMTLDQIVDATLRISALGLVDIYQQAWPHGGVNLLVVVDQFEELFRYRGLTKSPNSDQYGLSEEAVAFVRLLLEACAQRDYPIYVALTMRSDFLGDCAQLAGLPEAINESQFLVPRMSRADRRSAIEGPVAVAGGTISPVLLTRLVNDVGDNPDQLSILQHALNRTWAQCKKKSDSGGELLASHYEDIGSMVHALDRHAEKAWAELTTPRQQEICEKVFRALTDKGTDPRGIRRPRRLSSLCALSGASQDEVAGVLKVFRKPSRSFLMPPVSEVLETDTVIDISHESLMRVWERLKKWAEEEARSARMYRRTAETAALHKAGSAGLVRDQELETLLGWWEKEKPGAEWASQYQGEWESVIALLEESKVTHYRQLAEAEFDGQWRHLWRPLLVVALIGIFLFVLAENIGPLEDTIAAFPTLLQNHKGQQSLLILLSFCITTLLAGFFAVSYFGQRVFRATAFDRILKEVSTPAMPKATARAALNVPVSAAIAPEPYATFWRRLVAFLVDSIIFIGILFGVAIIIAIFASTGLAASSDASAIVLFVLALAGDWLYQTLLISSRWQATAGKRLVSIVVTDLRGNRLSFARASARYFARLLSWCTYSIGFLIQSRMNKKQTLHDWIAGCIVVERPRAAGQSTVPNVS